MLRYVLFWQACCGMIRRVELRCGALCLVRFCWVVAGAVCWVAFWRDMMGFVALRLLWQGEICFVKAC